MKRFFEVVGRKMSQDMVGLRDGYSKGMRSRRLVNQGSGKKTKQEEHRNDVSYKRRLKKMTRCPMGFF